MSDWRSMDHAFANVAEGIKGAVRAVRASPARPAKTERSAVRPKVKKPPIAAEGIPNAATKAGNGDGSAEAKQSARRRAAR